MRVRVMVAVGGLALTGFATAAPAANAAEPEIVTRTVAEAAPACEGTAAATYHRASCRPAAPGTQYRAGVNCTNSGWRNGPWRNQTAGLSNASRANCPAGGTAQEYRIQFR